MKKTVLLILLSLSLASCDANEAAPKDDTLINAILEEREGEPTNTYEPELEENAPQVAAPTSAPPLEMLGTEEE